MERLEDEAHARAAQQRAGILVETADVAAFEAHGTGVRHLEPGDEVEQRGLSDPGLAHDRDVLARRDLEPDAIEHAPSRRAAERLRDVPDDQHAGYRTGIFAVR